MIIFLIHHDEDRKKRYIARYEYNEDWTETGLDTAGFWSRWLLWNKSTIVQSINDIDRKFNIAIEYDSHHDYQKFILVHFLTKIFP